MKDARIMQGNWNFKEQLLGQSDTWVETRVYVHTAVTQVVRLTSKCTFAIKPHTNCSPNYNSALPAQGFKEYPISLPKFNDKLFVLFLIPFTTQFQIETHNNAG
jgi:hypothetical protein